MKKINYKGRCEKRMVVVQRHIRPEIHQLDVLVPTADTVDTAKTLDDSDRIPVDIIVDQIITVLQVLTFGNTVSGNQDTVPALLQQDIRRHL